MKTALIYGTTGLIGNDLLKILLETTTYDKVLALTRRPLEVHHPKLEEIMYDFNQADPGKLKADHLFCCMGTTIRKAGSTKEFYKIDHDFVVETAKLAKQNGATLFSLVSAIGANSSSKIFYNKVKGEVEQAIRQIGYPSVHIYRPSLLIGNRKEFRLMERIAQITMNIIGYLVPIKHRGVQATKVAEIMAFNAKTKASENLLVNNAEIIKHKPA